jgi:hypothetical protein
VRGIPAHPYVGDGISGGAKVKPRALLPLLLLLAALACGCQPEKQLAVSYRTYTVTLRYLNDQREAGRIPDKRWNGTIAPARDLTKRMLDELHSAYVEGRPINWVTALALLRETMLPLLRQRELLEAGSE